MARRFIITMLIVSLAFFCVAPVAYADEQIEEQINEEPSVSAHSAALYCVNTGAFLMEENADEKLPMASTTKIMTALLALEQAGAQDKVVTVTKDMYAEGSSMYLKEGDKLKLSDLAVGMMTVSGNDAANAVALTLAGSFEDFAKLMNKKASQIGMDNSSFVTPSGLDDEQHYSTAKDMAKLMESAMENEKFAEIVKEKNIQVGFVSPEENIITYGNHNKLLSMYKYCNGGKTGYTKLAGRCLVTSAQKDGVKLIAVTLSASDDWNDHINMYEYGFSSVSELKTEENAVRKEIPVVGSELKTVKVSSLHKENIVVPNAEKDNIKIEVDLPRFVYAPLEKGQVVGKVRYMLEGKEVAAVPLTVESACAYKEVKRTFAGDIKGFFSRIFGW